MAEKVLITEPIHPAGVEMLRKMVDVRQLSMIHQALDKTEDEYIKEAEDAVVIMTRNIRTPRRVIEKLNKTKTIVVHGAGYDHIDIQAATDKGIIVCNTPQALSESVAEHVIALALALFRGLVCGDKSVRAGNWVRSNIELCFTSHELSGKTIGIIGLGQIGSRVAKKAKGLDMKVLAYDPWLDESVIRERGAEPVHLEMLLKESDVVSVNCPLTSETRGMLGKEQFKIMKKSAIIVNTARGGLIDESALIEALRGGQIAGAALDVLVKEPPERDNPLLSMKNVVLTPHIAGLTEESTARLSIQCAEQAMRTLRGEMPINIINKDVLKKL